MSMFMYDVILGDGSRPRFPLRLLRLLLPGDRQRGHLLVRTTVCREVVLASEASFANLTLPRSFLRVDLFVALTVLTSLERLVATCVGALVYLGKHRIAT